VLIFQPVTLSFKIKHALYLVDYSDHFCETVVAISADDGSGSILAWNWLRFYVIKINQYWHCYSREAQ
jgi:hypothetical protein